MIDKNTVPCRVPHGNEYFPEGHDLARFKCANDVCGPDCVFEDHQKKRLGESMIAVRANNPRLDLRLLKCGNCGFKGTKFQFEDLAVVKNAIYVQVCPKCKAHGPKII